MSAADGGRTWEPYPHPLRAENATVTSEGTIAKVQSGGATSLQEKRSLLSSIGANPDTVQLEGNDLWPESRRAELEAAGYVVESTIPGIVGTLFALTCARSTDRGETCSYGRIEGLPRLSRMYGSFRSCIELSDGALLAACVGRRNAESPEFSFALRSTDDGKTWSFHPIAEDTSSTHQWNETEIMELPNALLLLKKIIKNAARLSDNPTAVA